MQHVKKKSKRKSFTFASVRALEWLDRAHHRTFPIKLAVCAAHSVLGALIRLREKSRGSAEDALVGQPSETGRRRGPFTQREPLPSERGSDARQRGGGCENRCIGCRNADETADEQNLAERSRLDPTCLPPNQPIAQEFN